MKKAVAEVKAKLKLTKDIREKGKAPNKPNINYENEY